MLRAALDRHQVEVDAVVDRREQGPRRDLDRVAPVLDDVQTRVTAAEPTNFATSTG